ncbi:hypothetical protein [Albidovulum sp.]
MTRIASFLTAALTTLALAAPAAADCVVAFKAKRDNPLKLQFGTMTVAGDACGSAAAAAGAIAPQLAAQGWTLLTIVSIKTQDTAKGGRKDKGGKTGGGG